LRRRSLVGKQFIRLGDIIIKKSSIVFVRTSAMLSPDKKPQVEVRLSGKTTLHIATSIEAVVEAFDA
jgi:hypothetical protein